MGLDTTEIAKLAATGLGAAVQILIATMGVKAAEDVIEGIRKNMVAQQRGPNEAELDAIFDPIIARDKRIQDA